MGAIGGLFGLGGGDNGTGQPAPVTQNTIGDPISQQLTNTAYQGTQNSLQSQQALLQALQAQNGLSNQNQVYGQLQGVVNGTGPNPAQAMLNQSTGQNIAAQSALMAGQRGAGSNVGLMARQIGQQGAATQQQAVGQGATLQANQSLNALGQAGTMANTQASNQVGQTNANTAAQQAQYQAMLNAQAQLNSANAGLQANANSVNGQLTNTTMQGQQNFIGGALNGLTGNAFSFADGGAVGGSAFGGSGPQSQFGQFLVSQQNADSINSSVPTFSAAPAKKQKSQATGMGGLQSALTSAKWNLGGGMSQGDTMAGGAGDVGGAADLGGASGVTSALGPAAMAFAANGGKVPALVSPGEKYLRPKEAEAVAMGQANPNQVGEVIPGKPKFKGNNYANDTVPKELDEGGVVIPNEIMQSKDPVRGAAEFVRKCLAKKGMKA